MKQSFIFLKANWWVVVIILFSLISLIVEVVFAKLNMVDFEVYYHTAKRLIAGQDLYGIALDEQGHYIYKYSPVAAFLFVPFAMFPIGVAKYLYWIVLTILLVIILQLFYNLILSESDDNEKLYKNAIFFAFLTILIHFDSELHLGQINLLLLTIYVFIISAYKKNKKILLSFLLVLSIFIKPFGLIFLPYLLLKRRYITLLYFSIFTVILFLLPLIFYPTFESFAGLYKSWIHELLVELGNKQDLFAKGNHTIFSVLARYSPLQFILGSDLVQKIYQLVILASIGILFYKLEKKQQSILAEMAVLIILIPLFAFTSKNAFIFAMPLSLYLLSHIKTQSKLVKALTITGCCLIGGNLYEVYGPKISMILTEISIYTIGSILLLTAIYFFNNEGLESNSKISLVNDSTI